MDGTAPFRRRCAQGLIERLGVLPFVLGGLTASRRTIGLWKMRAHTAVHFVSVNFRHSEGLSDANLHIMKETAAFLRTVRGPWVLAADFNMPPDVLRASGWLDVIKGVVHAPLLPTCHGSTYDYFVASSSLAHAVVAVQN